MQLSNFCKTLLNLMFTTSRGVIFIFANSAITASSTVSNSVEISRLVPVYEVLKFHFIRECTIFACTWSGFGGWDGHQIDSICFCFHQKQVQVCIFYRFFVSLHSSKNFHYWVLCFCDIRNFDTSSRV